MNIDKPRGLTSHGVVAQVRRLTRLSRVGHAGTLDPLASGVLLVGLGRGTKLTQFLHEYPKTYRATLRLGVRTDTHDAAGRIIAVKAVGQLARAQVEAVLAGFAGAIEQIPPMYSALKWQGQRLYTLARQGFEIKRQPRPIHIFRITLVALSAAAMTVEVECSSGTYIRVLADDIGTQLGCGAHLTSLIRTAVGPFRQEQAVTLEALAEAAQQGTWGQHVMALEQGIAGFSALHLTAEGAHALGCGVAPSAPAVAQVQGTFEVGETVAIKGPCGTLLAMGAAQVRAVEVPQMPPTTPLVRLRRVLIEPR